MSLWWWKSCWKTLKSLQKITIMSNIRRLGLDIHQRCVVASGHVRVHHPSTIQDFLWRVSTLMHLSMRSLACDEFYQTTGDSKCSLSRESAVLAPSHTSHPCWLAEFLTQGSRLWLLTNRSTGFWGFYPKNLWGRQVAKMSWTKIYSIFEFLTVNNAHGFVYKNSSVVNFLKISCALIIHGWWN